MVHPSTHLRRMPRPRAWLWAMVAMLLLKAALPLLALGVAKGQGVALVEVCSVYGTRMVPVDGPAEPAAPQHPAGDDHCPLASLVGPWTASSTLDTASLPAPAAVALARPGLPAAPPADAHHRWLTARLHAPPVTA